ncbi:hypothetical protein GCM10022245_50170 [Streptomyces mayteni]
MTCPDSSTSVPAPSALSSTRTVPASVASARSSSRPSRTDTAPSSRSRSHQAPAGPSAVAAMCARAPAGNRRTAPGSSDHTHVDQPVPSPLCGARNRANGPRRSGCGRVFQRTPPARATTVGLAPCSASSAAVSNAAWPAPTTVTSVSLNRVRSRWSLLCEASPTGNSRSGSGRWANGITPTASTTVLASSAAPSAVSTRNPSGPPATDVTVRSSTGTGSRSANQRP